MGVQSTMTIGDKKAAIAVTQSPGGAFFPTTNNISIISLAIATDEHRLGEIHRAIGYCIDYARDNNLFSNTTLTDLAVITTLNGGKAAVRTELIAADVVLGEVGIMLGTAVRVRGATNITENAHRQLLDWAREAQRLAA